MITWTDVVTALASLLAALTGIAAIVAVFGVRAQLQEQKRQMHREFEGMYVQRYWQVSDARRAVTSGSDHSVFNSADVAYIELCEDEVQLWKLGRLTTDTWAFWKPAIVAGLQDSRVRAALAAHPERFAEVRNLIAGGDAGPPSSKREMKRRGLD